MKSEHWRLIALHAAAVFLGTVIAATVTGFVGTVVSFLTTRLLGA